MGSYPGRRILIDGSMARAGGGFTYLVNLVPRLAALRPADQFLLWVRNPAIAASLPSRANLDVEILRDAGWIERLRFTHFEVPRRVRSGAIDLYFSVSEYAPLRLPCAAIASFRNPNAFTSMDQGWPFPQRLRLWVLRQLARRAARSCDRILFMSEDAARWIGDSLQLAPERRAVVPHGIDVAFWSRPNTTPARLPEDRAYVLSVSTIYRYKNFVRLIEAWARLARRLPDVPDLVILGGDEDPEHRRQMEQARVATGAQSERIHVLGEVPYSDVRGWYAGASLFVFPSYLETFGHPLLEAMAMELPVVAADTPVFREIGDAAVRFADPMDVESLAAAMEAILRSPPLRADLAARGRARAAKFSWDRSAEGTAALFDAVLEVRDRGV
jgi:glycosyltransferase involved in cell wall biosynthesis